MGNEPFEVSKDRAVGFYRRLRTDLSTYRNLMLRIYEEEYKAGEALDLMDERSRDIAEALAFPLSDGDRLLNAAALANVLQLVMEVQTRDIQTLREEARQ